MDMCVHVCLNGHTLVTSRRISRTEFCEKCGAKMIDRCQECGAPIREWDYHGVIVFGTPKYERASYCKNCGKPYPWTQAAIKAAAELVAEEDELDEAQRGKLVSSLPDIITETPKTQVAVVRFKKALTTAGKFTAEGLRQFAIDFGCELAKKQLGL